MPFASVNDSSVDTAADGVFSLAYDAGIAAGDQMIVADVQDVRRVAGEHGEGDQWVARTLVIVDEDAAIYTGNFSSNLGVSDGYYDGIKWCCCGELCGW